MNNYKRLLQLGTPSIRGFRKTRDSRYLLGYYKLMGNYYKVQQKINSIKNGTYKDTHYDK